MRWTPRSGPASDSALIDTLAREAQVSPLIAQLLMARGVRTPEEAQVFLAPNLSHLHAPALMAGLPQAAARLHAAIARQERILIYGDYDVDGTVAIVILKTAIELCGGTADFHVPHRIRDGYGMKDDVIERAAAEGVRLIISVDVGIRAFAAAETARRAGVDLIVTDHHLPPPDGLPRAFAVVNPNQPGCDYPCKALCGAGVAFKLAQALLEQMKDAPDRARLLPSFLKILAIATIADAVPLVGENRVFTKLGLEGLRAPVNLGLRALMEVSALSGSRRLIASDVGFRLAPRINAAGRMDVARDVIELFSTRDRARAKELAEKLNRLNADRRDEEKKIIAQATQKLEEDAALRQAFCIVVDGDGWHRGVIGIAATRVVEKYGRPALVVANGHGESHGSGRSISAFHLLEALESCAHLFTRFGGHAHAVGFALPQERVPELRAALDAFARTRLTLADFEPALAVDAELTLDQVTPELLHALQKLEPFGMDNPEPVFAARGVRLLAPPRPLKDVHVKLRVGCEENGRVVRAFDGLAWRRLERCQALGLNAGEFVDLAFTIEENPNPDFGGGLQLNVCDFQRAEAKVGAGSVSESAATSS